MFLLTPARLRALTWVGAFVSLVLMTQGTCTWGQYTDRYSVTPLPRELACELALTAAQVSSEATCVVVEQTDVAVHAKVQLDTQEPVEVCLLKAARWFVVDHGPRVECPTALPSEPGRIASWSEEWKVESRWQELVTHARQVRERQLFRKRVNLAFDLQKGLAPFACPSDLPVTDVPSLDVALVVGGGPWHFVSDDGLEKMFGAVPSGSWNAQPPPPAMLVLVDFKEKQLPVQQHGGFARGTMALIDWGNERVLCKALVTIEQPDDAARDLTRPDVLMPDFKDRVVKGLATQLTLMTGGSVGLLPTW